MNKTQEKVIPLIQDFILYEILTEPNLKEYVSYIVSKIMNMAYDYVLKEMTVISPRHRISNKRSKRMISDIVLRIGNNIINIEGNKKYYKGLLERNHIYYSKLISNSLSINDSYKNTLAVTQINFNNFAVNKSRLVINEYLVMEKRNLDIELELFKKFHMNLDRIKKKCYNNNKKLTIFERYLAIMIIEEKSMLKKIAKGNRVLERVVERIMEINENYDEWVRVYDVVEENNRMWRTIVANKEEEAMEKEKKAVEKEKQKAEKRFKRVENKLHKAENNTIQIVKNLLKQNLDINLISKVTGMSVNKIKSLNIN